MQILRIIQEAIGGFWRVCCGIGGFKGVRGTSRRGVTGRVRESQLTVIHHVQPIMTWRLKKFWSEIWADTKHIQPVVLYVTRTANRVKRATYSELCYTWHVQLTVLDVTRIDRVTSDTYSQLCYTWHVQLTVLNVPRTANCVTSDRYSQLCYTWHVQLTVLHVARTTNGVTRCTYRRTLCTLPKM